MFPTLTDIPFPRKITDGMRRKGAKLAKGQAAYVIGTYVRRNDQESDIE
jgi:hypothetical protein